VLPKPSPRQFTVWLPSPLCPDAPKDRRDTDHDQHISRVEHAGLDGANPKDHEIRHESVSKKPIDEIADSSRNDE
jgi:hypothetical protein